MPFVNHIQRIYDRFWTGSARDIILVSLLLFILVSLLFWKMVWWQWILFDGDMWTQYYPAKWYSFSHIKAGKFPLWTPNLLFGFPLFAEAQTGMLYPLSIIFLLLPTVNAFNISIIIRLILAGLFTYLYVRRITNNKWAAVISGVTFSCSGYMMAQLRHENVENALIWLPLILLALDKWITENNRRWLASAGLCLGVSFLAGYFYISLFVLVTSTAYYIFKTYFSYRDDRMNGIHLKRWLSGLVLFGLIGVGLSAVQLLPSYELAQESVRSAGISYQTSTQVSVPPFQLICLLFPKFFGYPVDLNVWGLWRGNPIDLVTYIGILPLFLALGALMVRRDRYVLFFGVLCGTALLLSFGQFSPLWYVVNKLPVFSMMRNPARFLSLVTFSGSVLAGLGFVSIMQITEEMRNRMKRFQRVIFYGSSAVVILSLFSGWIVSILRAPLLSLGRWFIERFVYNQSIHQNSLEHYLGQIDQVYNQFGTIAKFTHPYIYLPVIFIISASALIWFLTSRQRPLILAGVLCLILAGTDLVLFGREYNVIMPKEVYEQRQYYVQIMDEDPDIFRYAFAPLSISMRNYDALLFDKMYSQGHSPIRMQRQLDVIEALRPYMADLPNTSSVPLMNFLNIKYIIPGETAIPQEWAILRFEEVARVYENRDVLPRAFMTPQARVLPSSKDVLAAMSAPDFAPRHMVLLDEKPDKEYPNHSMPWSGQAKITHYDLDEVLIDVEGDGGFLVLADTFYPGWYAEIDGVESPILRGNYMFRTVYVEPGVHHIRFKYDPFSFKIGMILSFLALGIAAGVFVSQRKGIT